MKKKYIVRLTDEERIKLKGVISKMSGSSQKVRRAQILLKVDVEGLNWTDAKVAEAFSCMPKTVENARKRLVVEGFEVALNGKLHQRPVKKKLDGEQEAKIIAMRLGPAPKGYANWSLRLLASQVVELGIVDSICPETIRQTIKKTV